MGGAGFRAAVVAAPCGQCQKPLVFPAGLPQLAGEVISGREGCSWGRKKRQGGQDWVTLKELSGRPEEQGFIALTQQPIARATSQGGPHEGSNSKLGALSFPKAGWHPHPRPTGGGSQTTLTPDDSDRQETET